MLSDFLLSLIHSASESHIVIWPSGKATDFESVMRLFESIYHNSRHEGGNDVTYLSPFIFGFLDCRKKAV